MSSHIVYRPVEKVGTDMSKDPTLMIGRKAPYSTDYAYTGVNLEFILLRLARVVLTFVGSSTTPIRVGYHQQGTTNPKNSNPLTFSNNLRSHHLILRNQNHAATIKFDVPSHSEGVQGILK